MQQDVHRNRRLATAAAVVVVVVAVVVQSSVDIPWAALTICKYVGVGRLVDRLVGSGCGASSTFGHFRHNNTRWQSVLTSTYVPLDFPGYMYVCVCEFACLCACVSACLRACVLARCLSVNIFILCSFYLFS